MRLRNPNLGPNSGKRTLDARILDPNSWVKVFDSVFFFKQRRPTEKCTLEKFTFQNSTQKSGQKIHIAPLQGHLVQKESLLGLSAGMPGVTSCVKRFSGTSQRDFMDCVSQDALRDRNLQCRGAVSTVFPGFFCVV